MNQYPPEDPNQTPNQQPNSTPPPPHQSGDYGQYPAPANYPSPYGDSGQGYPPPYQPSPYGESSVPPTQYAPQGPQQYGQQPPYVGGGGGAPPYAPQPPYGPQRPYGPPPRKSNRTLWIVLGIVAAIVVLSCGGGVIAIALAARGLGTAVINTTGTSIARTDATLTAEPASTPAPAPTNDTSNPTPVPSGPHLVVGKTATVGSWQATVNSVTTNPGDGNFNVPKNGNTFLLVDVTVVNNTSSTQPVSSILMFTLQDPNGGSYTESFDSVSTPAPDANLAAGASLHGVLTYDVPLTQHTYKFSFQPDLLSQGQAIWDVSF